MWSCDPVSQWKWGKIQFSWCSFTSVQGEQLTNWRSRWVVNAAYPYSIFVNMTRVCALIPCATHECKQSSLFPGTAAKSCTSDSRNFSPFLHTSSMHSTFLMFMDGFYQWWRVSQAQIQGSAPKPWWYHRHVSQIGGASCRNDQSDICVLWSLICSKMLM